MGTPGHALRLQFGAVLGHAVGSGGGGHQQVGAGADGGLDVELQVAVEHLHAALVGNRGPLREKALVVGHAAGRGRGGRNDRRIDGQQDAGHAGRGGDDAPGQRCMVCVCCSRRIRCMRCGARHGNGGAWKPCETGQHGQCGGRTQGGKLESVHLDPKRRGQAPGRRLQRIPYCRIHSTLQTPKDLSIVGNDRP